MKLLILLQWGKVIRYWIEAVAVLRTRGVDVTVGGLQSSGPLHELLRGQGVEVFSLDADGALSYPLAAIRLTRMIRGLKPDAVLGVGSIPTTLAGVAVRRAGNGKCIALRNYVEPAELAPFPQLAPRVSHYTMAVSRAAAAAAQKQGVSPDRICVALNGAAAPRIASREEVLRLQDSLRIPRGSFIIGVIARLRRDRGHIVLLRAIRLLPQQTRDRIHVVFVGEGPERGRLEAEVLEMGLLENVHLVGEQSDTGPWMALADTIVVPSLQESFGKAAAEAMSAGTPVVASTTGGLIEFVFDQETGLLFESGSAAKLSEQLLRLLTDESLAESLSRNGMRHYESRLTIASMVDRWLECFASFGIGGRLKPGKPRP